MHRLLAPMDGAPGSRSWSLGDNQQGIRGRARLSGQAGDAFTDAWELQDKRGAYLAVVFFIQSSQGIFPQNGIWTIWGEKETVRL